MALEPSAALPTAGLQTAIRIAKEAGSLILEGYRTQLDIQKKGRIDLVTEYDLKSERLIHARLTEAFPDHRVIGEESLKGCRAERPAPGDTQLTWYVDPIDGTTNFAHGHPYFAVSLGLYAGERPVLGVVHAPALGLLWAGGPGLGAHRNQAAAQVSQNAALVDSVIATGFPYHLNQGELPRVMAALTSFVERAQGFRRCGSAAVDLCMVADGSVDLYYEKNLNAWDLAGGVPILLGAGGQITNYAGAAFDLFDAELVASNGRIHDEALGILQSAFRQPTLD